MSNSSRGSLDNLPRKRIPTEEMNKQLSQLTSQIDALRSDVQSNQETLKSLTTLQRGQSMKQPRRGESFKVAEDVKTGGDIGATATTSSTTTTASTAALNRKGELMEALFIGDIISLQLSEDGYVFGDIRMNCMGVEHLEQGETRSGSTSPNDAAFRLCPKLNYRYLC
jgi:TolA-binding protein